MSTFHPLQSALSKKLPISITVILSILVKQSLNFLVITSGSVSSLCVIFLAGANKKSLIAKNGFFIGTCLEMILAKYEAKCNLSPPFSA